MNCVAQSVDPMSRVDSGKLVVLVYVQDSDYELIAMVESDQQKALGDYILGPQVGGQKEVDWYRVDNEDLMKKVLDYAKGNDVDGTVYGMSHIY